MTGWFLKNGQLHRPNGDQSGIGIVSDQAATRPVETRQVTQHLLDCLNEYERTTLRFPLEGGAVVITVPHDVNLRELGYIANLFQVMQRGAQHRAGAAEAESIEKSKAARETDSGTASVVEGNAFPTG